MEAGLRPALLCRITILPLPSMIASKQHHHGIVEMRRQQNGHKMDTKWTQNGHKKEISPEMGTFQPPITPLFLHIPPPRVIHPPPLPSFLPHGGDIADFAHFMGNFPSRGSHERGNFPNFLSRGHFQSEGLQDAPCNNVMWKAKQRTRECTT